MCLHTLDDKPPKKTGKGWKVVIPVTGKRGRYTSSVRHQEFQISKWAKADTSPKCYIVESGPHYDAGFHIWLNREDAEKSARYYEETLVLVEYRKARVSGKGEAYSSWAGPQIVADEMRIVKRYPIRKEKV